jgi:hypothetical protein
MYLGLHWACCAGTRYFCSKLAAPAGTAQNIFFLAIQFYNSFVSIAQQAGQSAVLGCLSFYSKALEKIRIGGGQKYYLRKEMGGIRESKLHFFSKSTIVFINYVTWN